MLKFVKLLYSSKSLCNVCKNICTYKILRMPGFSFIAMNVDFICGYWLKWCKVLYVLIFGIIISEDGLSSRGFVVTRLNTYTTVSIQQY